MCLRNLTRFGLTRPSGAATVGLIQSFSTSSTNTQPSQFGWEFTADEALTAYGARIYLGSSTLEETARLWRVSDEALLASVNIVANGSNWVEGLFSSSVALASGANYIITTRRTGGQTRNMRFGSAANFTFDSRITHVTRRGVGADTFPTSTFEGGMAGFADVLVGE